MKRLTVGSLFAGIGGFDLGLERAGFEIKWQVEIDPFCRAVLAKHWPQVKRYEDVRTVGIHAWAEGIMDDMVAGGCGDAPSCPTSYYGLEPVDVMCGGFPCQDISPAGRRAGIRGKQSGLWSEFHRLIRQLRPRYVVVENSSNLMADGYGMDVVVGELAAIGYDAEWDCLPVAAFGAPHKRERVWIVAYPGRTERRERDSQRRRTEGPNGDSCRSTNRSASQGASEPEERALNVPDVDGEGRQRSRLPVPGLEGPDRADTLRSREDATDAHRAGPPYVFGREAHASLARFRAAHSGPWWDVEPEVVRVVHGVSAGLVRRRERHNKQVGGLGNAISPFIAHWIGERILEAEAATVTR